MYNLLITDNTTGGGGVSPENYMTYLRGENLPIREKCLEPLLGNGNTHGTYSILDFKLSLCSDCCRLSSG